MESDDEITLLFRRHTLDDLVEKLEHYAGTKAGHDSRAALLACAGVFRGWLTATGDRIRCTRSWGSWVRLCNAANAAGAYSFAAILSAKLGVIQARGEAPQEVEA